MTKQYSERDKALIAKAKILPWEEIDFAAQAESTAAREMIERIMMRKYYKDGN